jgi:hypothetical protein
MIEPLLTISKHCIVETYASELPGKSDKLNNKSRASKIADNPDDSTKAVGDIV